MKSENKLSLDERTDELLMEIAALSYVKQEKDALHNLCSQVLIPFEK